MKTVTVEARDFPDMAAFRRLSNLLGKMRWVESIETGSFDEGNGTITLRYPEKLVYLATRIDRDNKFKLLTMDDRSIIVTMES